MAYFVFDDIEEREDCIIIYCCEKACNDTQKVLCLKPDELYEHNSDKSVYKLYDKNNVPELVDKRYMATKAAMRVIYHNVANDAEIYEALGRDGVELAEKIRKEAVDILRKKEDVPKHIVVNDISIGKQTRQMIWDLDSKSILDVVKLRRRSDDDYTLEMYLKKLKTIALRDKELVCINDITGIEIYVISKNEVLKKFESFGFINVYDKNGVDSSIISHIKSGYANIIKAIGRKRISSCKELDYSFPFL